MELQEYYTAAVGEKNTDFYLSRFHYFDSHGVAISWNWPAFFFTFYWLLHRKMRLIALLYALLPLPVAIIDSIVFSGEDLAVAVISLLYLAAAFIVLPMYANALYYRQVRKMIDIAREESRDEDATMRVIIAEGGTNSLSLTITTSVVLIAALVLIAVVMEMVLGSGV